MAYVETQQPTPNENATCSSTPANMKNIAPMTKATIEFIKTPPKNKHLACLMDALFFIGFMGFCGLLLTSTNAAAKKQIVSVVTDPAIFYALSVDATEPTNLYAALGLIASKKKYQPLRIQ